MAQRKGHREPQKGSQRVRASETAAANERAWWAQASVVLAARSPLGVVRVLVRVRSARGLGEAVDDDLWLEPGLRDPLSARVRSAAVRRSLLAELEPVLRPLRARAARAVRELVTAEKERGKPTS